MSGLFRNDLREDAEAWEQAGEFLGCNRTFIVEVLNTGLVGDAFHAAANDSRVPKCGDSLGDYYPNIKCERRFASLMGHTENGWVRVKVRCEYGLQRPPTDPISVSGDSTLNQIKTTKDRNGNYIGMTVGEEFKIFPVTVLQARNGFAVELTEQTSDPETLSGQWISTINSAEWRNGAKGEWMVMRVRYILKDRTTSPFTYTFTYEFDRKPGGHKYAPARYDDDGVLLEEGSPIVWHYERDFNVKFPYVSS